MSVLRRGDSPSIAFDVVGDGPPAVFLHGLTSRRQSWGPVTRLLAADLTCVRIDLRGHGESSRSSDYSMLSLANDVRAVVQEVGIGEPVVVGHSLGVTVAAVYAAAHGARGIVCVDGSLRLGDFGAFVQTDHADALRGENTTAALLSIDRELGLEPYDEIEEMERRILFFPRDVVLGIWEILLTTPPDELTATAEAFLPRIGAPLLSLHGSPPPPDYASWLTRLVPTAQVEVWEGTGHMLHLVEPRRFAARVRQFVNEMQVN